MRKLRPALPCICLVAIAVFIPTSIIPSEPAVFAQSLSSAGAVQANDIISPILTANKLPTAMMAALPTVSTQLVDLAPPAPAVLPAGEPVPNTSDPPAPAYISAWEPVPFDTCMKLALPPCLNQETTQLPPAPSGFAWKRLEGVYTFSAYAHPSEDYFLGDPVDIPGIQGLKAKDGFLFGVYGLGMQGGGYIWQMDTSHKRVLVYIRFINGHWELDGQNVMISDQWYYEDTGKPVDTQWISSIRLIDARFAMVPEPDLTPYYSVAASPRFPIGTKIYVPGLTQFGGTFEVQDRGGAFGPDSQRFDIYVGNEMSAALQFIRLGAARSNLVVYALEPE